jgi:CrcB protein
MNKALSTPHLLLAVLCGGFLGTITRYLLSIAIQGIVGKGWPYDILLINLTGAFALAFVTTLADATLLVGLTRRLFINVGFMGAYTTFSSLALGDLLLFAAGNWLPALLYLFLSLVGGGLAVLAGDFFGKRFVAAARRTPAAESTTNLDLEDDLLLTEEQTRHP